MHSALLRDAILYNNRASNPSWQFFLMRSFDFFLSRLSSRTGSSSWNLLLLHQKMLSQKTVQGWEEGAEGRGGPQVRATIRQHVQGQGTYSVFRDFM